MKFTDYINQLTESYSADEKSELTEFIVDACKEMKISIRSVEFEENGISVHYNHDEQAPEGYRGVKNEVAADIKSEVTDILSEKGITVKSTLRSTVEKGVSTLTFITKK